jgi:hypothetical protein
MHYSKDEGLSLVILAKCKLPTPRNAICIQTETACHSSVWMHTTLTRLWYYTIRLLLWVHVYRGVGLFSRNALWLLHSSSCFISSTIERSLAISKF